MGLQHPSAHFSALSCSPARSPGRPPAAPLPWARLWPHGWAGERGGVQRPGFSLPAPAFLASSLGLRASAARRPRDPGLSFSPLSSTRPWPLTPTPPPASLRPVHPPPPSRAPCVLQVTLLGAPSTSRTPLAGQSQTCAPRPQLTPSLLASYTGRLSAVLTDTCRACPQLLLLSSTASSAPARTALQGPVPHQLLQPPAPRAG